jgi:hypothetical protein
MDDIDLPEFFIAWATFLQEIKSAVRQAPMEEATRPLATMQTRAVLLNMATAKLLKAVGERDAASVLHQCAEALQDVVDGIPHSLFNIEEPAAKAGRRRDTSAVWRIRSNLCLGLEYMIAGGMKSEAAIDQIAKQHRTTLVKLHRPGTDLKSSIRTWRKSFTSYEVTNTVALAVHRDGMNNLKSAMARYSGDEIKAVGEKLVMAAAERSARLP